MKPVATLDGYVTPKEAAEMFAKLTRELEAEEKKRKEKNKMKNLKHHTK